MWQGEKGHNKLRMKLISYNVKGLGCRVKWKEIMKLVLKEGSNIVFLQEMKIDSMNDKMCGII